MSDYKFNQPKSVIQSRNKLKFIKKNALIMKLNYLMVCHIYLEIGENSYKLI